MLIDFLVAYLLSRSRGRLWLLMLVAALTTIFAHGMIAGVLYGVTSPEAGLSPATLTGREVSDLLMHAILGPIFLFGIIRFRKRRAASAASPEAAAQPAQRSQGTGGWVLLLCAVAVIFWMMMPGQPTKQAPAPQPKPTTPDAPATATAPAPAAEPRQAPDEAEFRRRLQNFGIVTNAGLTERKLCEQGFLPVDDGMACRPGARWDLIQKCYRVSPAGRWFAERQDRWDALDAAVQRISAGGTGIGCSQLMHEAERSAAAALGVGLPASAR